MQKRPLASGTSLYSSNFYDNQVKNFAWNKVIAYVPNNAKVLDVGCSSGKLGAAIKTERNTYVEGIDLNASDVKIASDQLDRASVLNIEQDNLDSLGEYEAVVCADVLEHLVDPTAALKKLIPHLKQGGRVIFSIPNMAHISVRLHLLAGHFTYTKTGVLDETHLHFYDETAVRKLFHNAGFTILEFDCTVLNFPDELITEKLAELGLSATELFWNTAHGLPATTWQFIGYAEVAPESEAYTPLETSNSTDEVLDFVKRLIDAHRSLEAKYKEPSD